MSHGGGGQKVPFDPITVFIDIYDDDRRNGICQLSFDESNSESSEKIIKTFWGDETVSSNNRIFDILNQVCRKKAIQFTIKRNISWILLSLITNFYYISQMMLTLNGDFQIRYDQMLIILANHLISNKSKVLNVVNAKVNQDMIFQLWSSNRDIGFEKCLD